MVLVYNCFPIEVKLEQIYICERECAMKWVEIEITTTEEASDAICEMLSQLGADGIAVCDPLEIKRIIDDPDSLAYADDGFVDSLGSDVKIQAYFAEFDDGIRLGAKEEEYENHGCGRRLCGPEPCGPPGPAS